jgi:hypothetical protein
MFTDTIDRLDDEDICWGAAAIGRAINANRRRTFYLLETGKLPAKKLGGVWVASRRRLLDFLTTDNAAA